MELHGPILTVLTPVANTILNAATANTTASFTVNGFNNHAFQLNATLAGNTTASFRLQSSLDNSNWNTDFTASPIVSTSSYFNLTGTRQYMRFLFSMTGSVNFTGSAGNGTASMYSLSGN